MKFKEIGQKIIDLKNLDLKFRDSLIQKGELEQGYNVEMEKIHLENADTLNEIIESIGYPTIDKVGKEANEAAWLIIQHSISNPEFMRKCASLLEEAVKNKNANPIDLAYLSDRIAVLEGRHQLYGTQFDWDSHGEMKASPFDDLETVNQRRKSIGLNTLEEQAAIIIKRIKLDNQTPPDNFVQRKKEIEKWKISRGWKNDKE